MYPEIFSADEQRERFRFHIFYNQAFITKKGTSQHFYTGLTADTLLSMFRTMYPDTSLTLDIVQHVLRFGGYYDNEEDKVYCNINEVTFSALPPRTQQRILDYSNYAKTLLLRQKMLGHDIVVSDFGVIIDVGLRLFLNNIIFHQRHFRFFNMVPKGLNKVSLLELYNFYQSYCFRHGFKPMTKHLFTEALVKKGCRKAKGYYDGVSGVNVFENIFVPWTEEDKQWSIEEGVGVITLDKKQIFNDGRLVANFTEDGLTAYLNSRKEFRKDSEKIEGKEQAQEEREETEFGYQNDHWGEDQDRESDTPGGEEKSGARGKLPIGIAENSTGECFTDDSIDGVYNASDERFLSDNPIGDGRDDIAQGDDGESTLEGLAEDTNRYPKFSARPTCEYPSGDDAEVPEGLTGDELPTTAELIAALRIPYKLNPTKFTKEEMQEYLQVINPKLDIESYWEVIMSVLTNE